MSKKIIKIVLIVVFTLALVSGLVWYTLVNQLTNEKAKDLIINAYNSSPIVSGDKKYPLAKGFEGYVRDLQYKVVVSDNNLFNPKISLIRASFQETDAIKDLYDINVIYLKRTGISSWEPIDYRFNTSKEISFDTLVDLTSKHDITTNFPGKENYKITNFQPLSQTDIDANRNKREATEQRDQKILQERAEFEKKYAYLLNKYRKTRELQGIMFDTKKYPGYYAEVPNPDISQETIQANKPQVFLQYQEMEQLLKQIQNTLNSGQNYTFPDNSSTLTPDQKTKDELTKNFNISELEKLKNDAIK